MSYRITFADFAGWIFGFLVAAIGIVNIFWGNDQFFGVFIFLASFIFLPPINNLVKTLFGFSVPIILKVILGVLIIWAAVGVGELFNKVNMMLGGN